MGLYRYALFFLRWDAHFKSYQKAKALIKTKDSHLSAK